ncbi:EAL domain-containing protein [Bacillus infantis]|uniref:EAL domain-containing protein n=2 Tax=Bacillus infantis TaxID=324767 RepID=A0A5D4RD79_9BACI|nr:EAL domain-containing protein [Bacillus infantis]
MFRKVFLMTTMLFESTEDQNFHIFNFSHVFQPIYYLADHCIAGYEGLIRSFEIQNPEMLFAMAKQNGKLYDLDIFSIVRTISTFEYKATAAASSQLSVNIFPSTLLEPAFLWKIDDIMKNTSLKPEQITFELNEAESVVSLNRLKEVVQHLKSLGFRIALDDLGKGQSSLRIALELEPDIIKLDRYFCENLAESLKKQKFLDWIASYFISEGVAVTLEGIETAEQLLIARQAGIQLGQGYYLGRPSTHL